jgi:hypothetical protein
VEGEAKLHGGSLAITTLTIHANHHRGVSLPGGGVTSRTLRSIPLGSILRDVRERVASEPDLVAVWEQWGGRASTGAKRLAAKVAKDVGRRVPGEPYSDDHYRQVALVRLELERRGSTSVTKDMAGRLGVSEQTVKDWTRKATERGFLTPGVRGRRGRLPGPKLVDEQKGDGE